MFCCVVDFQKDQKACEFIGCVVPFIDYFERVWFDSSAVVSVCVRQTESDGSVRKTHYSF